MPPTIVARSPSALPKRLPMSRATVQVSAVVAAISETANPTLTDRAAKLTPMASASMLVASAWNSRTGEGERRFLSLFFLLFMEGVPDHLAADARQDDEGQDAGVLADHIADELAEQIADERHDPLKDTEGQRHPGFAGAGEIAVGEGV